MNDSGDRFRLDGKTALITGGGTGIGLAIAKAFSAAGGKVVICGRRAEIIDSALREIGPGASGEQCDVNDSEAVRAMVDRVTKRDGPIGVLVNNAGTHLKKDAEKTSESELQRLYNVHVVGPHALIRAVLPSMRERKEGSIIFISSMAAIFGIPQVIAYSAAKSAALGVVRTLATEIGSDNIRVNAIAPGFIDTQMMHRAVDSDPERKQKILSRTSLKRFGTPEDVAFAALYLASPASSFVTGTCLVVDGGVANGF